jgi:potassium intermediate/small conductance calcium-activated channel subfamily N protein 2
LKEKPYQFLLISLLISVFQLGYCLRIFERYFTSYSNQNFDLMSNTIWNVIITLTTVGYGDIYPKTVMGRVVGGIVSLWGLFLVSIFTVTLSNLFTFSEGERKAYKLGERLRIKD